MRRGNGKKSPPFQPFPEFSATAQERAKRTRLRQDAVARIFGLPVQREREKRQRLPRQPIAPPLPPQPPVPRHPNAFSGEKKYPRDIPPDKLELLRLMDPMSPKKVKVTPLEAERIIGKWLREG